MNVDMVILFIGILVFSGQLFIKLFDKTKIPDVLPLLIIGLFMGPVTNIVKSASFGKVGNVFMVMALIIILFESGVELDIETLKGAAFKSIRLTLANFLATVLGVALFSMYVLQLSILVSIILGVILGGTSSAVVIPILERSNIGDDTATILTLESAFSDVLCIVFTIGILKAVETGNMKIGYMIGEILSSFIMAGVVGGVFAIIWSSILIKVRKLETNLFLTQAFAFIVYGLAQTLNFSGAIAVLTFGLVLGNRKNLNLGILKEKFSLRAIHLTKKERAFSEEIVFLVKIFLFVFIGISIKINGVWTLLIGIGLTLILLLIRIPVMYIAFGKETSKCDVSMSSIMIPKGLAAAVLAALPLQAGMQNGDKIQSTVYSIILFSIILTSILVFLLEKNSVKKVYGVIFSKYSNKILEEIEEAFVENKSE